VQQLSDDGRDFSAAAACIDTAYFCLDPQVNKKVVIEQCFLVNVDSINVFKKRLDYTAEIARIGDRSQLTVEIDLSKSCVYI